MTAWRFPSGRHGKPTVWIDDEPAPFSFSLSHTAGLVGLAVGANPDLRIGFDLEPLDRKANVEIAGQYFHSAEAALMDALTELPRAEHFLRLWTLKEAFVKATGEGLATDLSSFWFDLSALRIRFPEGSPEPSNEWLLEQRVLGQFVAALAMHRGSNRSVAVRWNEVVAGDLLSGRIASHLAQNDRGVDAAEGEVV